MAWVYPVVAGIAGAYAANKQASAANKSKSGATDQYTVQDPYMSQRLNPGLNAALDRQAQLFDMVPQIGPGGQVTYADPIGGPSNVPGRQDLSGTYSRGPNSPPIYEGDRPPGVQQNGGPAGGDYRVIADPSRGGGAKGKAPAVPPGGSKRPDGRIMDANGKTIYTPPAGGSTSKPGGGGGGNGAQQVPGGKSMATTPQGMFRDIYQQGMGGPSQTVQTGDRAMQNILGAAGGNPPAGGEHTGFEGYNPILNYQANQLMGEDSNHSDLLMNFLGGQYNGGSGGGSGSGGSGGGGGGAHYNANAHLQYQPGGGAGAGGAGAGNVPDSMRGSGWFQDRVNEMWGQGPDPELQTLIDAYAADAQKAGYKTQAGAQAAAAGAGRLGGGSYNASMRQVAEDTNRDIGTQSANIRVGDRAAQKAIQQNLLGQVNTRDISSMQDATQRYGIDSSASSAAAGSAAAAASANRGQDLNAILGMMSYDTDQRKLLSGIGSELSSNRISTLGLIPGQENARYAGTDRALGAAGAYGSLEASNASTNAQRSIANASLAQQRGIFNAQQQQGSVDAYLRTLGQVGGMGGESHTWGTNVVPGAGISTGGATAAGALGGALAGWGAYNAAYR